MARLFVHPLLCGRALSPVLCCRLPVNLFKAAEKKTTNLSFTCSVLRRAARTVSSPTYEYKAPLEHYSFPPSYIAQRIITAANELSVLDVRNTGGRY